MSTINSIHDLSDDQLESCVDGITEISLLREILSKQGVLDEEGWIDPEIFADYFAQALEGFIDEEEDSDEWTEAYDNNWSWGYTIGDNINDLYYDLKLDGDE